MEKYSETSQDRLLDQCSDASDETFVGNDGRKHISTRFDRVKTILQATILLLLLYIAVLLTISVTTERARGTSRDTLTPHFTLPRNILEFEERPEWLQLQHPWSLPASDELDEAWDDLLYSLNIRVTSAEFDVLNENKTNRVHVTGNDRTDYVAVLGVYHHMHCLNNIRRLLSWDYYGPKTAGSTHLEGFAKEHSIHCINTIRQALMCHANTGLYTSEWDPETSMPSRELKTNSVTTCVKWDSLNTWARQRALRPGQYKYLRGASRHD